MFDIHDIRFVCSFVVNNGICFRVSGGCTDVAVCFEFGNTDRIQISRMVRKKLYGIYSARGDGGHRFSYDRDDDIILIDHPSSRFFQVGG